jgi:two-component system phosphate regulon sensor histidine kinase PhoR
MSESKDKRTLFILYTLGIYILFQATWWAYHLINLNKELYEYKSIILGVSHATIYQSKTWMIIGEGSIFILLLLLGFWWIRKNISKELRLARMEKTFLLSVTHELKTPIAAVKLFLETLRSRKLSEDQQTKIISDALRETNRLQDLSENILLATRLDQRGNAILSEDVNFSETARHITHRMGNLFPDYKIQSFITPDIIISSDHQLITALITNLIENAIKYSPKGSNITIKLTELSNAVKLQIIDEGIGISNEEKQRIFDKFYRIGNEDTRKTKGTGLGLYIVKNIVKLHSGVVSVTNNTPQGSIFEIVFPKK